MALFCYLGREYQLMHKWHAMPWGFFAFRFFSLRFYQGITARGSLCVGMGKGATGSAMLIDIMYFFRR